MPNMPLRRVGVALLAAAIVFTTGTAFAADLNLTAPGTVGAGSQTISAPCTSVTADYTIAYRSGPNAYYVDAVVLHGTGCAGTGLTVRVTLKDGATNPETTVNGVDSADMNDLATGPLTVSTAASNVTAASLVGIAVLVTGP
jgi:hypothetical protein